MMAFDLVRQWVGEQGYQSWSCSMVGHHRCEVDFKISNHCPVGTWVVSHIPVIVISFGHNSDFCLKIYVMDDGRCVFSYESSCDEKLDGLYDWSEACSFNVNDPKFFDDLGSIIDLSLMGIPTYYLSPNYGVINSSTFIYHLCINL